MQNKMNLRVILLASGIGNADQLLISDKMRVVKTYPFGNHMGCVVEVNHKGTRSNVRVCPDTAYGDGNAPFVILKQQEDGTWAKYYDTDDDTAFMYARFPGSYQYAYDRKFPKRPPVTPHMGMLMRASITLSKFLKLNRQVIVGRGLLIIAHR